MNISGQRPLHDYIVIEPLSEAQLSSKLIEIPEQTAANGREGIKRGRVHAVGPGLIDKHGQRIPVDVGPGEVVLYSQVGAFERYIDGQRYDIVSERNVFMVVEDKTRPSPKKFPSVSSGFPILIGKPLTAMEKKHGRRY